MTDKARRIARTAIFASLLAVSAALLLPAITGRPVVSYASSGSMEPTIGVLDVFFVNPWPTDLAVGDIIVYRSETQGGPAVHRIVGGDATGWFTRGDANAGVDQDRGEPRVARDRILGKVITSADGGPILLDDFSIPYLEANAKLEHMKSVVGGGRALLAIALLLVAIVFGFLGMNGREERVPLSLGRRRLQRVLARWFPRGVLGRHVGYGLLAILVATTVWSAAHAVSEVQLQMVVVQDPSSADGVRASAQGGSLARTVEVDGLAFLPTLVVIEPGNDRVSIPPEGRTRTLGPGETGTLTAVQTAVVTRGLQEDSARIWVYPALLPPAAMVVLHDAAPGAPYLAVGVVAAAIGAVWFAALGVARLPVGRILGLRETWR